MKKSREELTTEVESLLFAQVEELMKWFIEMDIKPCDAMNLVASLGHNIIMSSHYHGCTHGGPEKLAKSWEEKMNQMNIELGGGGDTIQ